MSLHARLYAARAARTLQEQARLAGRLRADARADARAGQRREITRPDPGAAAIPSPRQPPTDPEPVEPGPPVATDAGTAD